MRIARFRFQGQEGFGIVEDNTVYALMGNVFTTWQRGPKVAPLSDVTLLAPCQPSKIVALGLNYASHAAEMNVPLPEEPLMFLKPPTAVIGPEEPIRYPRISERVDYEAELAVVIGKRARHVPRGQALDFVLGYTCGNDVTARDLQSKDGQWTRSKGFDTFCPLGPWIETELDPSDLAVQARVNGQVRQSSRTSDLIFGVADLVSFISQVMTLLPGDVIMTGTPSGIGPLQPGDVVEVEIEGIGVLRNPVEAETET